MSFADPWIFGWTQLLTIIGFVLTGGIAFAGFRTFERWKREKLEEKRIEIGLEASALGYEAKFIFDAIRNPGSVELEWEELKGDKDQRRRAGPFFAILKRLEKNSEYFERVWKLQPRFMAVFGKSTAATFMKIHQARSSVQVSAGMLMRAAYRNEPYRDDQFRRKLEAAVWNSDAENDEIGTLISDFEKAIEAQCFPIIRQKLRGEG
ncbi:MAG: hypothetical protein JSR99_08240 [Proteobacteria bacterium]|nr:hypothetical protein [Pseudomonadota bacterium]